MDLGEVIAGPGLLLVELGGAIARRTGHAELSTRTVSLVQRLPNVRLISVDAEFARLATQLAVDLRLQGADALYVALAQRLDARLITWDQEQRERGRHAITALTPQQALQGS